MAATNLDFDGIVKNLPIFGAKMQAGVLAILKAWITECETEARLNRPWQDRTGNARQGLQGWVDDTQKDKLEAYLTTQMDYGVVLETHGYEIIIPTLTSKFGDLTSAVESYVKSGV